MTRIPSAFARHTAPGQAPQKPGIGTRVGRDEIFARQVNQQQPLPGKDFTHGARPGGTELHSHVFIRRTVPHDFFCRIAFSNGTAFVRIQPGTYNGQTPKYNTTPLDSVLYLPVGDGVQHLYLRCRYILTFTQTNNEVSSGVLSDGSGGAEPLQLAFLTSLQDDPWGPTAGDEETPEVVDFYILIASFLNRVKTAQYLTGSISGVVCDAGNGGPDGPGDALLFISRN